MSSLNFVPIPLQNPIANVKRREFYGQGERPDSQEGLLTVPWIDYLTNQSQQIEESSSRVGGTSLSAQSASIAATDMTGGSLSAGYYRVTYYARITVPASVSSSLTVSFDWTDGGVGQLFTGAAMTGNTTTTWQSETKSFLLDALAPVRISTLYASVGTVMQYSLTVTIEKLPQ